MAGKTFYQCPENKDVIVKQAGRAGWIWPKTEDLISAVSKTLVLVQSIFERLQSMKI